MLAITISNNTGLAASLTAHGRRVQRAMAAALNACAREIREAEKAEMQRVFKHVTPWTLRATAYYPARPDNLQAEVYLNRPFRMSKHYLYPVVAGTVRALKGFERGINSRHGLKQLVPTKYIPTAKTGAVSMGIIRQILSVLKLAETSAGYSANITALSSKRNTKERDYVVIRHRRGKLIPGVYRRTVKAGYGASDLPLRPKGNNLSKAWQSGRRSGSVRARGLVPYLLVGRGASYRQMFDFYGVARRVAAQRLVPLFNATLAQYSAG